MSLETAEIDAENIEILLLQGQALLAAFPIMHFDDDEGKEIDRIIVKSLPREVELYGKDLTVARVIRVPVEVEVHYTTKDAAAFAAVIAAVEAANDASAPAEAITAATAAFPNGCKINKTDDGERDHTETARSRTKTFNFILPV